jgi:hypothetical protein
MDLLDEYDTLDSQTGPEKVEVKWTVVRKGRWSGEFDMNTVVALQMDYEIETRKGLDSMGWRK